MACLEISDAPCSWQQSLWRMVERYVKFELAPFFSMQGGLYMTPFSKYNCYKVVDGHTI